MTPTTPDDPIMASLAATHSAVNARHAQARALLLESLVNEVPSPSRPRPVVAWPYIAGAIGLCTTAAAVALALWLVAAPSPAVAMEKLAKALDQVTGYTYRMEMVYVSRKDRGRTVRQVTDGSWRTTPVGLHAIMHIVETAGTNTESPGAPKTLVDLEESHQANQPGIVIDHLKKEYWEVNETVAANSIPPGSPQVAVYMVQQRRGRVLQDLGEQRIDGHVARGLEIMLDASQPVSELGPTSAEDKDGGTPALDWRSTKFEVWIDPKTDLPIEFRCARRGDDFETTYRFTNLNWNVDFAADAFDTRAPSGYTELDKSPFAEGE
jgi:hypothetical protein